MIKEECSVQKGISGSTLKIIAMTVMIIDHIGVALWGRLPDLGYLVPDVMTREEWYFIYRCMRNIGRSAFPIFCFLIVEGFWYTSNRLKYAVRLFLFALLSQLPFHYAFLNKVSGLNVFFTLLIGMLSVWGMDRLTCVLNRFPLAEIMGKLAVLAAGGYLAYLLKTDYQWKGVVLIGIFYLFYKDRVLSLIIGYFSFILSSFSLPGFILIWFYNGKRGIGIKYLFYLIYPVHLLVLYVIWRYLL